MFTEGSLWLIQLASFALSIPTIRVWLFHIVFFYAMLTESKCEPKSLSIKQLPFTRQHIHTLEPDHLQTGSRKLEVLSPLRQKLKTDSDSDPPETHILSHTWPHSFPLRFLSSVIWFPNNNPYRLQVSWCFHRVLFFFCYFLVSLFVHLLDIVLLVCSLLTRCFYKHRALI